MKKLFFLSACSLFCICTACAWEAEAARPACTNPCSTSMVPRTGTGTKVYPGTETPITDKKEKKSNIKDMEAKDTVSYLVGFSLGSNLEGIPYKFDVESFLKGVQVALEGKDCGYPMSEVQRILTQWQQDIKKQESEKSMENKVKGKQFLADNLEKDPDVRQTPSGLQYKVIVKGTGDVPKLTDRVQVNYEGRLVDGTVFDSSSRHGSKPATFRADQVIKGWTEALTMMPVGSKWQLFIPQELAYGSRDAGQIKPFSALIFDVELVGIEKAAQGARKSVDEKKK